MDLQDKYIAFSIRTDGCKCCKWRKWRYDTDTLEEMRRDTNDFTWVETYLGSGNYKSHHFTCENNYILYGQMENNKWEILIRLFHHSRLKDKRTILDQIEDIFGMIDKLDKYDYY
jgi:hypothetical protein